WLHCGSAPCVAACPLRAQADRGAAGRLYTCSGTHSLVNGHEQAIFGRGLGGHFGHTVGHAIVIERGQRSPRVPTPLVRVHERG
ncbi:hypothetical protein LCGC14_2594290, partial [marine sediment metagenome]